jgi:hypothetical protein
MSLSGFFHSYPGLYVTQAFFHSLVASIVAEIAIKAWDVRDPAVRQRVFLVPVVAPVFLLPLFQLFRPDRGSTYFRLGTIFESGRWLELEMLGIHPVMGGLVLVFAITSLVFLFQELIPILRHSLESGKPEITIGKVDCLEDPAIRTAMETVPVVPAVFVVEDDDFMIYSTTGKSAVARGEPSSLITPMPRRSSTSTTGRSSSSSPCGVESSSSESGSLLFQDDPQFLFRHLRVFPFRHLHKAAVVGFPPLGVPTLHQAAQEDLRSVFDFIDRE